MKAETGDQKRGKKIYVEKHGDEGTQNRNAYSINMVSFSYSFDMLHK